jgi:hypothetical protein
LPAVAFLSLFPQHQQTAGFVENVHLDQMGQELLKLRATDLGERLRSPGNLSRMGVCG